MSVMSFNSPEEMVEYLRKRRDEANRDLSEAQVGLTYGDHWVQFADDGLVCFGRVATLEEVALGELQADASWEQTMAVVGSTAAAINEGYMYGMAYSALEPDGELGTTHKASVWPVEERLFQAAKRVDWRIDALDLAMVTLVRIAQAQYHAHMLWLRSKAEGSESRG